LSERRHVLLWGPSGAGKSTVGRLLADELGRAFVDTDAAAETRLGVAIPELFASGREADFRAAEQAVLEDALASEAPAVIAPGGGALVSEALRFRALDAACVVRLTCDLATRAERLRNDAAVRPLVAPSIEDKLAALESQRREAYAAAHLAVDASADAASVARRIAAMLEAGIVPLRVGGHAYAAELSSGTAAARLRELLRTHAPTSTFVVTDENVARLHPDLVGAIPGARVITLIPGEEHKRLSAVERIVDELVLGGADRSSLVVAIGGGVVSDLGGLAAALFSRGIAWVAVPTTLLSMVDASLGGKTGANLSTGKNLVGAFHHPSEVVVDPERCLTESSRSVASGLSEALKSALVGDATLLDLLERPDALGAHLAEIVRRSLVVKARIVEADPTERGVRAHLNFGHTFGHALEVVAGFGTWTHGEAVAAGMVTALQIGEHLGRTPHGLTERIRALLTSLNLPTRIPPELLRDCHAALQRDKKRTGGRYRFVLIESAGRACTVDLSHAELVELSRRATA